MLNNVSLMGRLTIDPELRHTPSNVSVTTFSIAVDRSYVKQGSERQTDFVDIVAWRSTAEFITRYFKKGQMIAITGSIQTRNYQDANGNKRKATEVVADNVYFCESKRDSSPSGSPSAPKFDLVPGGVSFETADAGGFEEIADDDDLPF